MLKRLIAACALCFLPMLSLAQDITIEVVGPNKNAFLYEGAEVVLIGRDETNQIQLNGPFVSRSHAKVTCFSVNCLLTDLRSTNGTTLNRTSVQYGQNVVLGNGDVIGIAGYKLTFFLR